VDHLHVGDRRRREVRAAANGDLRCLGRVDVADADQQTVDLARRTDQPEARVREFEDRDAGLADPVSDQRGLLRILDRRQRDDPRLREARDNLRLGDLHQARHFAQ
jgi:hypothetical protein